MKQVTMESVKQRIADLESAGKVVGGLSLSSEFELSCLRELVAVTEQRDALVAENAVILQDRAVILEAFDDTCVDIGMRRGEMAENYPIPETPATSSAIAALREEATEAAFNSDKHAALCDSAYVSGMQAGWNFGVDEDVTGFQQSLEAYRKPMREACRQLRESKGEVQS